MINYNRYEFVDLFRFAENGWFRTPWGRYGLTMVALAVAAVVFLCLGLRARSSSSHPDDGDE